MPSPNLRRPARTALLVILAAMLLGWSTLPAHGDDLTWSITPVDNEHGTGRPNFNYTLEPGTSITDAVQVTNRSAGELTLQVYGADAFTTASGDLDLLPAGQPSVGLGAWLTTADGSLTLAPGESRAVAFTIKVPQDARPGDHPGGVITSHAVGTGTVRVDQRFALRIHVRVPGELLVGGDVSEVDVRPGAAWNPIGPVDVNIHYNLQNPGTARTYFTYRADLAGPFGLGTRTVSGEIPELMPGSTIASDLALAAPPLFLLSGNLRLTPQALDGQVGDEIVVPLRAVAIPWGTLAALALVIGIAVAIGIVRARRNWEFDDDTEDDSSPAASHTAGGEAAPEERQSDALPANTTRS